MLKRLLLGALAALALVSSAFAQSGGSTTRPTWFDGTTQYYISTAHPMPISGSFSASGFPTVQTTGTPISVTTGGVTGSLPAGTVVVATNVGTTNGAYCKLGASSTTSDQYIAPNGGWFAFTVGANTQLTCITSTSTTTVNMVGGSGLPTGTGGGGGSSGSSGAVFGPTANGSAAANPPVLMGGTANGTATGSVGNWKVDSSGTGYIDAVAAGNLINAINAAIPPQSPAVPIGGVGLCDGANGATNPCTTVATVKAASTPAAATDKALVVDQRPGTTVLTGSDPSSGKATPTEAFLALPATTTTQIIALSGSTKTYITSAVVLAGGTVNVTFKYGTGANCGTGTTTLNGPWPLTAQAGFSKGSGLGAVMIVPAGQALCITTDASVAGGVDLTYQQF